MKPSLDHAIRLLQRLIDHRIEFVLIGGVAALVHGSTLTTRDVDVCARFDQANLKALAAALADLNPRHRITPQRLPLAITDQNWSSLKNLYLDTDWGTLDCLGEVSGLGDYDSVLAASEVSTLPFGACRVLTLDGIIRAKEAAGRPHDIETVRQLKLIKARKDRNASDQ